jgi:EAL domain-containing protein (putative c-di-GMP-specific phosphodiesterase class I)/GGDEF domain-containing protein
MSLFKQLAIILTLFLGVILVAVMMLNFQSASEFVRNQLNSDAKNTAYSLGLSLSKVADPSDMATMETMINAIYDSGYYERIALLDIEGKPLYVRETKVRMDDVPQWFIDNVTIENVTLKSDIMMGWSRFGTLEVSGHTGHAYRQLYLTLTELVETFVLIGIVVFALLFLLLRVSLRSLSRIEKQAAAILDNEFIIEKKIPFTTEFRSLTQAMNTMVVKVKDIFEHENETLRRYQELLYIDAETKLHNRRYLTAHLPDYLLGESSLCSGGYAIFSFEGTERLKKELGYESYIRFISHFASALNEEFSGDNTLIARLNENDFMLICPSAVATVLEEYAVRVMTRIREELKAECAVFEKCAIVGSGIGHYSVTDTLKTIFSRADYTVTQAKSQGNFMIHLDPNEHDALVLGHDEWRTELLQSIAESRMLLAVQSVVEYPEEGMRVLHDEILIRLLDREGMIRPAGYFIPIATKLGLMDTLDRYVIDKAIAYLRENSPLGATAINLSSDFIKKHTNREWLRNRLELLPPHEESTLLFEVSNSVVLQEFESVQLLSALIKGSGCRFGIDHFVLPEKGAEYLQILRPDYLKSNVTYLQDLLYDEETGSARESLNILAKSMGIEIIAINVEEGEQLESLKKFGITRFQGSYISAVALV